MRFVALTIAIAIAALLRPVQAATYTWNGDTASGNWTANVAGTTNWSPNAVPPSTADVAFTLITAAPNVNLQGARTINSLTIGTIQNYTLTGGSLGLLR